MRHYTGNLPKCLLPVDGKTIIDWIVEDSLALPYVNDDEPLLIILGDTLFDADI